MTGGSEGQAPRDEERSDAATASAALSGAHYVKGTSSTFEGADLMPLHAAAQAAETGVGALLDRVSGLIEQTRAVVAAQANAALTLMNWHVGRMIDVEVLQEGRAGYDQEIVATLSPQLTKRFGRGFNRSSLYRMIKFSQAFPNLKMVAALSPQLSWSHFREVIAIPSANARTFYAEEAVARNLSVRELRHAIGRKAFERRGIADSQIPEGSAMPVDAFRDPMLLDILGLKETYLERDLEESIIRELEPFLLEVGRGWAFIARQKRMTVDGDDFHLDLLFYSRPLKRLIAVELKIGKFKPSYKGQMDLYLKWLDRFERQPGEEAPIGLILCTEASREQIELLEMHKDGIVVAEYWTSLPPKEELESRIKAIYRDAQERIVRRQISTAGEDTDD